MHLFLNFWAICGPIIGILLGSSLSTKNERRRWMMDNKRAEYRTLLTTISDCGSQFILSYGMGRTLLEAHQRRLLSDSARRLADVVTNRLFIADEVHKLDISKRFQAATSALKPVAQTLASERVCGFLAKTKAAESLDNEAPRTNCNKDGSRS